MIPPFAPSGCLPPGIWSATIEEIEVRFATNPWRQALYVALANVIELLRAANCSEFYLDGSFVCDEAVPGDYDLCYEPTGMCPTDEFNAFLQLTQKERKKIHLGDIFIRLPVPPFSFDHVQFWQTGHNGESKGIISIVCSENL